jgi:hypothetical protein
MHIFEYIFPQTILSVPPIIKPTVFYIFKIVAQARLLCGEPVN